MRDIAKLLLGDEAAWALGLPGPDRDQDELFERARRSGEWCATTPGLGSIAEMLRRPGRASRGGLRPERQEI
jgi:hypothetical protein